MKRVLTLLLAFLFPLTAIADLEAHFLDVGHGDCTIIVCDGEAMIIDGGEASQSSKVFSTIKSLGIMDLKYAVASHPHDDHIGGLPAAFHAASVSTLITSVTDYDSDRLDVLLKTATNEGANIITPRAGDTFHLGAAEVQVLSPTKHYYNINDMSLVLRMTYGDHVFLFTGDATKDIEADLIKSGNNLSADVLKVAHHGSTTSTSDKFVKAVAPAFAVIICSETYDNPSRETLLALSGSKVLVTRMSGDIVIRSDGKTMTSSAAEYPIPVAEEKSEATYIGNKNSKIFHYSTCPSVDKMKETNKIDLGSKKEAESMGYRPCKNCSP